ncbi:MAG: hypothetical protein KGZ85_03395 [Ignavibacterium sp.]|jgi:ABC-type nickel/cobalt efflux system permease component RcnA|nr:hypothetical protein [Ignavibacterium sp.]
MTWYIILALLIGFGFYLLYSNKNRKVNMQSVSDQNVHNHHSDPDGAEHKHSGHDHNKGHGCC